MSNLQKVFAVFVVVVAGVIIYMYISTKETSTSTISTQNTQETEVNKGTKTNEANNPMLINWKSYSDVKNGLGFKYPSDYQNPVPNEYTDGKYIELKDAKGNQMFMVIAREKKSEECYLGLCEGNIIRTETVSGTKWDAVNLSECVGGCGAIGLLYRTVRDGDRYYIVFWKGSESIANDVLSTFTWQ